MGVESGLYQPTLIEAPTISSSSEQNKPKDTWEDVTIGEEQFKVKRDRQFPATYNGEEVMYTVNEYHHPESGVQISVISLGLTRPTDQPAIVRADYGCPCMAFGPNHTILGHDCGPQRTMMFDTIAELGIGAIAIVSEQTAAGNGHGAHVVFDQMDTQARARMQGEHVPTMQEYFDREGYFPFDNRRHELVAKVIADTVGLERPVIPAMSSQKKIDELTSAGLTVIEGTRVDLITSPQVHPNLRRDGYHTRPDGITQLGAYITIDRPELGTYLHTRLDRQTYGVLFQERPLPKSTLPARRLPN